MNLLDTLNSITAPRPYHGNFTPWRQTRGNRWKTDAFNVEIGEESNHGPFVPYLSLWTRSDATGWRCIFDKIPDTRANREQLRYILNNLNT